MTIFKKNKYLLSNLQIGDNDLVGNKFNGHNLHLYLRERSIDSNHLVSKKLSDDKNTFYVCYGKNYGSVKTDTAALEKSYNVQSMFYPFAMDIMNYELFQNADIVHYHLINNYFFNINMLPLMTRMKPSIWTIHDPWVLTGHCVYPFGCKKWLTHCSDCPHLDTHFSLSKDTTALNFELKRQIIQNSKLSLIVASKWMKNNVENSPVTKGLPVYHVPFGVNQEIFKPKDIFETKKKLGIDPESFTIMFRSDNSAFKGLDIIKYALKSIKTKNQITLITVVEKGLLKDIKKAYPDKFKIKEYGWVKEDKELAELYQACDLFLMPSKQEAFGMMAIEAMSCGKPVLATEGTSLPDVINAPECGFTTAHSSKAYAAELQNLIDNPQIVKKIGLKSLEFARQNYNHEVYVDRMIDVYKEVMAKHKTDKDAELVLKQLKKYNCIKTAKLKKMNSKYSKKAVKEDYKEIFEYINMEYILFGLKKKYKEKKILLYGSGILFEALCDYCDLSIFNIIAVTDKRITEESKLNGFKAIPPENIRKEKPDVILITALHPFFIEQYLTNEVYLDSKMPEVESIITPEQISKKIYWYS